MKALKGIAYINLILAMVLWGISFTIIEKMQPFLTIDEMMFLRLLTGMMVLGGLHFIRGIKTQINKKDLPKIFLAGLFGMVGYGYFEYLGIQAIGANMGQKVIGLLPIIILAIAMLVMKKRTKLRNILWVGLSFAGMLLVTQTFISMEFLLWGDIGWMVLASTCWAIYVLLTEQLLVKYDGWNVLTIQIFFSGLVVSGSYFIRYKMGKVKLLNGSLIFNNPMVIVGILFLGVMGLVAFYYLYGRCTQVLGAVLPAVFIHLMPVVTLLIMVILEQEKLELATFVGALMIAIAIYMIEDI